MERSFKKEVESLKLGDGDVFRGEGILAVTKALLQSGVSYVGGYQGAPVSHLLDVHGRGRGPARRPRRACRDLHQRGVGRRHAGRLDQLSAARRRHLEIDRRHQRGGRRALEPRLARRGRRRDDHPRRGLRRRRERHPGALLCLRAEIVDVAARSAARPADHRAHGREGLRAVGGEPRAGHAGAAHPRLSRHRRIRHQEQPARGILRPQPHRRPAALRLCAARASAGHCSCTSG